MKFHFGSHDQFEAEGGRTLEPYLSALRDHLSARAGEIDRVLASPLVGGYQIQCAYGRVLITRRAGYPAGLEEGMK